MFQTQNDISTINKFLTISKPSKELTNDFIIILSKSPNSYLQELLKEYDKKYTPDLYSTIKKSLSGNLQNLILSLFTPLIDFDCIQLRNALEKIGTNEEILIEIISSRENSVLKLIKEKYSEIYKGRDLIKDIKKETNGSLREYLLLMLEGKKNYNTEFNQSECEKNAKDLVQAMDKMWGSEDCIFNKIFCYKSPLELSIICREYHKLYNFTLLKTIDNEFSGNNKKFLNLIISILICPSEFFARKINKAVKDIWKDEKALIRVLISRRYVDLVQIKLYYRQLFKKNIIDDIKDNINGIFGNIILEILKN